jgi:hypothetical protein
MRAVDAASDEGALPAVVSHEPTLRTAPVDARAHYVRADSQISKNRQNQGQGWPMSEPSALNLTRIAREDQRREQPREAAPSPLLFARTMSATEDATTHRDSGSRPSPDRG